MFQIGDLVCYAHITDEHRKTWRMFDPFYLNKDVGLIIGLDQRGDSIYATVHWTDGDTTRTDTTVLKKVNE